MLLNCVLLFFVLFYVYPLDEIVMVIIALLSTVLARTMPDRFVGIAGYVYFPVPFYFTIAHSIAGRRQRQLERAP